MKKKILYVHGYNGSPYGHSFSLLEKYTDYELISIDYDPEDPVDAINKIKRAVYTGGVYVIVASSLGAFLTANAFGIPRILFNPCWIPSAELPKIGYNPKMISPYVKLEKELPERIDQMEKDIVHVVCTTDDELLRNKYHKPLQKLFPNYYELSGPHHLTEEAVELIMTEIVPKIIG